MTYILIIVLSFQINGNIGQKVEVINNYKNLTECLKAKEDVFVVGKTFKLKSKYCIEAY